MLIDMTFFDKFRPRQARSTATIQGTPAHQSIEGLKNLATKRKTLNANELSLIETARNHGETWETLATALGKTSGQAMQQHYRRLGGRQSWPTRSTPRNQDASPTAVDAAGRTWPVCSVADLQPGDQMPRTLGELHRTDGMWVTITHIDPGTDPGTLRISFDMPDNQQGTWPNADPAWTTPFRRTSEMTALKTSAQALLWWEAHDPHLNEELTEQLRGFGITPANIDDGDAIVAALHTATRDPATSWQINSWNERAQQHLRPDLGDNRHE